MCEGDDIVFQVTRHGIPIAGAEVELRHFENGIHFEAATVTNVHGASAFVSRPAGRYDLLARLNNSTMGQIFFKIPPCISQPSGVGYKKAPVIAENSPHTTQTYANGLSREFYDFVLFDGRAATRVILRADKAEFVPNQSMQEQIPLSIASSENTIGFEHDYPQKISINDSLLLSWERGSAQFERSYVIYRTIDSQMAQRFGAPAIVDMAVLQPVNASASNQTAAPAKSDISPPAQASMSPFVVAGAVVSGVLVGGYVFLKRRADAASDKKSN